MDVVGSNPALPTKLKCSHFGLLFFCKFALRSRWNGFAPMDFLKIFLLTVLVSLFGAWSWADDPGKVLFKRVDKSAAGDLEVVDDGQRILLKQNSVVQTVVGKGESLSGKGLYNDYFHGALLINSHVKNVYEIGLGGGHNAKAFLKLYPEIHFTSAEIDPDTAKAAFDHFGLPKNHPRLKVHVGDGRKYLEKTKESFDLIIVDAYMPARNSSLMVHSLSTVEFFKLCWDRLTPGGVLSINVASSSQKLYSLLVRDLGGSLRSVFGNLNEFVKSTDHQSIVIAVKERSSLIALDQEAYRENYGPGLEEIETVGRSFREAKNQISYGRLTDKSTSSHGGLDSSFLEENYKRNLQKLKIK
ncbi:MAG: hypothetical protein CL677_04130 [Bdellovibrionaceae bacterium]|nr:hypothetical protein [Pseudobdellovibrionaceae bacterium]